MHGLFGFDVKSMSDEELLERWHDINRKSMWVSRFGSAEMMGQLQSMKYAIEFEQRERIVESRLRARAALPEIMVESDPDLAREAKAAREAEVARNTPKQERPKLPIVRDRIKPTSRPVDDNK